MNNEHESQIVDWDQVLRDIQDENEKRVAEILDGSGLSEPAGDPIKRDVRMLRIFDLFIPPGAR